MHVLVKKRGWKEKAFNFRYRKKKITELIEESKWKENATIPQNEWNGRQRYSREKQHKIGIFGRWIK